jgi:hypothetical protein
MTNWIQLEEARLRHEEAASYFTPERQIIEEIARAKRPSLRHRITHLVAGRNHDRYEEVSAEKPEVIIEPGDLVGAQYVVWHPGKDY